VIQGSGTKKEKARKFKTKNRTQSHFREEEKGKAGSRPTPRSGKKGGIKNNGWARPAPNRSRSQHHRENKVVRRGGTI